MSSLLPYQSKFILSQFSKSQSQMDPQFNCLSSFNWERKIVLTSFLTISQSKLDHFSSQDDVCSLAKVDLTHRWENKELIKAVTLNYNLYKLLQVTHWGWDATCLSPMHLPVSAVALHPTRQCFPYWNKSKARSWAATVLPQGLQ